MSSEHTSLWNAAAAAAGPRGNSGPIGGATGGVVVDARDTQDEERQAALRRLTDIEKRGLYDSSLTPDEAHTIIAWIGELQLYGLKALAREVASRG